MACLMAPGQDLASASIEQSRVELNAPGGAEQMPAAQRRDALQPLGVPVEEPAIGAGAVAAVDAVVRAPGARAGRAAPEIGPDVEVGDRIREAHPFAHPTNRADLHRRGPVSAGVASDREERPYGSIAKGRRAEAVVPGLTVARGAGGTAEPVHVTQVRIEETEDIDGLGRVHGLRQEFVIGIDVLHDAEPDLLGVGEAGGLAGRLPRLGQRG